MERTQLCQPPLVQAEYENMNSTVYTLKYEHTMCTLKYEHTMCTLKYELNFITNNNFRTDITQTQVNKHLTINNEGKRLHSVHIRFKENKPRPCSKQSEGETGKETQAHREYMGKRIGIMIEFTEGGEGEEWFSFVPVTLTLY